MNYSSLLAEAENYIRSSDNKSRTEELPYHNIRHTEQVVEHVMDIAKHYKFDDLNYFIVVLAAWFHDIGYRSGEAPGHEERSVLAAEVFLKSRMIDKGIIDNVNECILATKMPQSPRNLSQEILCDADLYNFGSDDFLESNKLIRKETELLQGEKIDKNDWCLKTIALIKSHHFFTEYCRDLLNDKKLENLAKLEEKADKKERDKFISEPIPDHKQKSDKKEKQGPESDYFTQKKQKSDRPEKGIETMFRISSGNHQRLSDMADNKANIMISTNSIIISVLLSTLLRKLEDNAYLVIPTILLLVVCVTAMVFSILSTRPSVPAGTFTEDDIKDKKVNLLFFGNFYKMSFPDYASGMQAMMDDKDFLYGSLIRDIYSQGVVLGKKYRHLRIAYNIFMFGIVISVLAFVLSSFFFGS